ncbi:uncharacterized protein [Asterias amurensis]|uniref:uncharacterized protein n=1 Tax=Asterias amurensis TaxID=7602 RepID=UPI003AB11BD2
MDLQLGHCWNCVKRLPDASVRCDKCPFAEYCNIECKRKDGLRHLSFECQMYGIKRCDCCGALGVKKECGQCNELWYCNKECQLQEWPDHKSECNIVKTSMKLMAKNFAVINEAFDPSDGAIPRCANSKYYLCTHPAVDFLQLDNNEWSEIVRKKDLVRDYHVLSVASGTLSNTVLTVASLPAKYRGSLYITLNDFDPLVMARNVLFLFMLVRFADTEGIESSLTTIWYSVHIAKKEYDLIKTSLDELIQMTPQSLTEVTQGLVKVQGEDLAVMSQVWDKWRSLECQRGKPTSVNNRARRKAWWEEEKSTKKVYLSRLTKVHKPYILKWFDDGLFLPIEANEADMPLDNPTLTEPGYYYLKDDLRMLKDRSFMYCLRMDLDPFYAWDCPRVRESETRPCSSPIVMYHNYITNLIQKVKHFIQQGRLHVQISLADSLDFPSVHKSLKMPNYDRIFTSTLADFVGFPTILLRFKPLLNTENRFSVIVTASSTWGAHSEEVYVQMNEATNSDIAHCHDTPMFVAYLIVNFMTGAVGSKPDGKKLSFNDVKTYNGMKMRDFRNKLNKLVPFQYNQFARSLTLMSAFERAVEWCLPNNNA